MGRHRPTTGVLSCSVCSCIILVVVGGVDIATHSEKNGKRQRDSLDEDLLRAGSSTSSKAFAGAA